MLKDRIEFLDGFRGLAILMVIVFHAYTRWPDIVPYGSQYATVTLFKTGYLGVQLFFSYLWICHFDDDGEVP